LPTFEPNPTGTALLREGKRHRNARRIFELSDELDLSARVGRHSGSTELEGVMTKPTEDQIRQRAHELWEQNHRPDGRDDEFWHQAERELNDADRNNDVQSSGQ